MRILLLGLSGTSRDILLAPFSLKSHLLADPRLSERIEVGVAHYKYLIPDAIVTDAAVPVDRKLTEGCRLIIEDILAFEPDLLGISLYTWNAEAVFHILGKLGARGGGAFEICLGGPELSPGNVLGEPYDSLPVDYAVIGEGEEPFADLVLALLERDRGKIAAIPRLAWRDQGHLRGNQLDCHALSLVQDLSELPSAYLTGAIPETLLSTPGIQANLETQRGCNFRCAYCLYHAQFDTIRYRRAALVVEEVRFIAEHGVKHLRITDANFLSDRRRAREILGSCVSGEFRMNLFFEVIPSFIDLGVAEVIKAFIDLDPGNKVMVGIGLQSLNPKSLKAIHRFIARRSFDDAFGLLSWAGATIKTDVILGLPHETRASWLQCLNYLCTLMHYGENNLTLAVLRILPGTDLETVAAEYGLAFDMEDPEHFVQETPTLPRGEMVECMRLNTVAHRLFCPEDRAARTRLRCAYFEVQEGLGEDHIAILTFLAEAFLGHLEGTRSDFVHPDFPNAEHYWFFDVFKEIPDEFLLARLAEFRQVRECMRSSPH